MGPKKSLGQHFLTAPAIARRIAEAVPASGDQRVVEIGPGRGAMSVFLHQLFPSMHLVEVDNDAIVLLKEKLGDGLYTIHHQDIMRFDFTQIGLPLHIVGNLPYNIGGLIIRKCLELGTGVRSCTFMVQREVAERVVSGPHKKTNGFLSIFSQFFGKPKILFHVPPGAFFPKPRVDSSVFQILIEQDPTARLPRERWNDFFAFVERGFQMRRKTLVNALSYHTDDKMRYCDALRELSIVETARAEDLDVNEWLELYKKIC